MGEIDGSVQRVYNPSWVVLDQIVLGGTLGVCLFSNERVAWVLFLDGVVDELFDF